MPNPQLEDGFLKLANEVVDSFTKYHLSGNEWQLLWVVIRKTYGFNKKEDAISLTQFQKETNLSRPAVVESLHKLVVKNILVVKKILYINTYGFNKDYSTWTSSEKPTSSETPNFLVVKPLPQLVVKNIQTSSETTTHKRHITKDNKNNTTKDILLRNSKTSNWYTTVLIKKEQSQNETTSIKTILGEYQNDTQDSIKMIRYKDIDKDIDKDIFKDKGKNLIKKERLYSLEEITQSDIEEIAEKYHCTPAFVLIQKEKMTNWAEAKGKRYKNYKSALRNWVIIAMEKTIEGRMQGNVRPAIDARGLSRKI